MIQPKTASACYRFEDFFILTRNRQLRRSDQFVSLNSKYFDVLI
jgi:DNA-binding winged helix-turn-helix (wHTH) protein